MRTNRASQPIGSEAGIAAIGMEGVPPLSLAPSPVVTQGTAPSPMASAAGHHPQAEHKDANTPGGQLHIRCIFVVFYA